MRRRHRAGVQGQGRRVPGHRRHLRRALPPRRRRGDDRRLRGLAAVRLVANSGRGVLPPCPGPSGVRDFHRQLPGYAPTPLREAPRIAARAGVGRVLVKDEADRLGLPAFKVLGASWAVYRALLDHLGVPLGLSFDALAARLAGRGLVLTTATDGNHGRAVAHVARRLGLAAHIFVPAGTSPARIEAIEGEGASCQVVAGDYDDAVAVAATAGAGGIVVSDTSWPGYETIPGYVIEGYATILDEVEEAIDAGVEDAVGGGVDTVLVPIGVGALAAAVAQWFRCRGREVRLIGVEPDGAHCALASIEAGGIVEVPGPHTSIMAGLNCGRPSPVAWPWLSGGFNLFTAIDDEHAEAGMRALAAEGTVSGETGAAAAGALLAFGGEALGLAPDATVLVLSTEGATDPRLYAEIVGT
ncbi:MAG: diaminopropionate ammonia-lyase [Acidimicrobiia bacterium]|nr:diaminopropionate ammonia-lyase [Acidimicrobiia bacterium]